MEKKARERKKEKRKKKKKKAQIRALTTSGLSGQTLVCVYRDVALRWSRKPGFQEWFRIVYVAKG